MFLICRVVAFELLKQLTISHMYSCGRPQEQNLQHSVTNKLIKLLFTKRII